MNKNVCIVHYNTPYVLTCLIHSINKHVSNTKIYIFENSDKDIFVNTFDNVKVFDNSKGQILDYETILEKYPERHLTPSAKRKWGSFKHCLAIQKCMELINEPFILMDSDVLIKKDFSNLYQEDKIFIGEIEKISKYFELRVAPYLCFINVNKCKEYNINYYNDDILGLKLNKDKRLANDTGCHFYKNSKKYKHGLITLNEYIIHYGEGSLNLFENNKPTLLEWINNNRNLWDNTNEQ